MHALLFPVGSHGDVHPFVGLGLALQRRGHRVTLFVNGFFLPMARAAGLDCVEMGSADDYKQAVSDPDLWHPTRGLKAILGSPLVPRMIRRQYDEVVTRFVPGETVVAAGLLAFGVRVAREKLPVPMASVHLQPAVIRSVADPAVLPGVNMRPWPRWLRRAFYWYADAAVIDPLARGPVNGFRKELGLPPARRFFGDWMHSPDLVLGLFPGWYGHAPDWPPRTRVTDFPLFDEGATAGVPDDVQRFLDAGGPPVVFTPGSGMVFGRPFFEAAADACRRSGRRGLLLTRFGEQVPRPLPEGVHYAPFVPFGALLPRAAALVHAGGIGTTAQGMRAGLPQLVMPLGHDQYDNADRLARLGVGAALLPKRFTGPNVAAALDRLLGSAAVAGACKAVAARFAAGDPLAGACDELEGLARRGAT